MGTFHVNCRIGHHLDREKTVRTRLLVDSGSECTWISESTLEKIGIVPEKEISFVMADGRTITRKAGFAIVRIGKFLTTDEVVFAQKGDLKLLGARSLEGLNLRVDSLQKKLVAGGPVPAAYSSNTT